MRVRIRVKSGTWPAPLRSCLQWLRADKPQPERSAADLPLARVREAIASGPRNAHAFGPDLAALFEQAFCALVGEDPALQWQAALLPYDFTADRLRGHLYESFLCSRLAGMRLLFEGRTEELLRFWEAIGHLTRWLVEVLDEAREQGALVYDGRRGRWMADIPASASDYFAAARYQDLGWRRPVAVHGPVPALWKMPNGPWAVVDYCAEPQSPQSQQMLAALYQDLAACFHHGAPDSITLVRFAPDRQTTTYSTGELDFARISLQAILGDLAGMNAAKTSQFLAAPVPGLTMPRAPEAGRAREIERVLRDAGAPCRVLGDPQPAPAFVRYFVLPEPDVRISSLMRLGQELQVRLNLRSEALFRKEGSAITLDLRTENRERFGITALEQHLPPADRRSGSVLVPAGVAPGGQLRSIDLSRVNHLLLAGDSESGRADWVSTAIAALLLRNAPEALRFVILDPSNSSPLAGSPYVQSPGGVYSSHADIADALEGIVQEVEDRSRLLASIGAGTLAEYSEVTAERRPRIVCLCEEYGSLFSNPAEQREIDSLLVRLGGQARAVGVHLILGTSSPEAAVSALLATSARIAFPLARAADSQAVLLESGAESLQHPGDLLMRVDDAVCRLQTVILEPGEQQRLLADTPVGADAA